MSNIIDLPKKKKRTVSPFQQNMALLVSQIVVIKERAREIMEEADELVPTIRKVMSSSKTENKD